MRFEIGSLRFEKYIEKKPTQYQPDFWGRQPSVGNFKKGSETNEWRGDLTSSFYRY